MRPHEIKHEIDLLDLSEKGLSEKLLLIEDVWDSIAQINGELPMPEWQKNELDKRYAQYQSYDGSLRSCNEVHEGLRTAHKDLS